MAALYARAEPVRSFLQVLSPAPLVFLALFLFTDPISKLAFPDEAQARTIGGVAQAPIVVVLLDELPSTTLLDERGRIDADALPGLRRAGPQRHLVQERVHGLRLHRARPAGDHGRQPAEEDKLPTSSDHPNSIFSLFGKTHRMNVSEEATTVCSRDLCERRAPRRGLRRRGSAR